MNIYIYDSYKEIIKAFRERHSSQKGYQGLLARKACCSPSYLSQCLNSYIHLTPDQVANLAEFWHLSDDETEYFISLAEYERAGGSNLQTFLKKKIDRLRDKNSTFHHRIKTKTLTINTEDHLKYYTSWTYGAIHTLVSIPGFQHEDKIAQKLELSYQSVCKILKDLEKMQLVEYRDSHWDMSEKDLHLPSDSPLYTIAHLSWRQRTISQIQKDAHLGLHYSGLHTIALKDVQTIREKLIETYSQIRNNVATAKEEELVYLGLDFFRL